MMLKELCFDRQIDHTQNKSYFIESLPIQHSFLCHLFRQILQSVSAVHKNDAKRMYPTPISECRCSLQFRAKWPTFGQS